MKDYQMLHEKAIACAKKYQKAEAELLDIIQKIDEQKVFRKLGYPSLFAYAVQALKLSESQAFNFINVARKAKEVPELKEAVSSGELSVSKARKIVPVIKPDNHKEWIQKAISLPQKVVEREVANSTPTLKITERIRPVAKNRSELRCGITVELENKIKRTQDLLSQKHKHHCNLEETLEALTNEFLERNDPLEKAKRSNKKSHKKKLKIPKQLVVRQVSNKSHIPAPLFHQVVLRDGRRCSFIDNKGQRCPSERWLEIHHRTPVSKGGDNTLKNLVTLCSTHHKHLHEKVRM